jgi:large subunit ribosomal protein L22
MKRIRPAPQGRAYRYQRRMAHIEIALAERGAREGVATVVGEETETAAKAQAKSKSRAAKKKGSKKK